MDIFRLTRQVVRKVFDSVFPLRPHAARITSCTIHDLQLAITTHALLNHEIVTLLDYRNKTTRDLIHALKYEHSAHAATLCADILSNYLYKEIAKIRLSSSREIVLMPVPLHRNRLKQRGYNQIRRVLERLPPAFRDASMSRVDTTALIRTRDTPHQTSLPRSQRLKNVADAFELTGPSVIHSAHIFIIDDVTTTGATLVSIGRVIQKTGAHVTLLSLARA